MDSKWNEMDDKKLKLIDIVLKKEDKDRDIIEKALALGLKSEENIYGSIGFIVELKKKIKDIDKILTCEETKKIVKENEDLQCLRLVLDLKDQLISEAEDCEAKLGVEIEIRKWEEGIKERGVLDWELSEDCKIIKFRTYSDRYGRIIAYAKDKYVSENGFCYENKHIVLATNNIEYIIKNVMFL